MLQSVQLCSVFHFVSIHSQIFIVCGPGMSQLQFPGEYHSPRITLDATDDDIFTPLGANMHFVILTEKIKRKDEIYIKHSDGKAS